MPNEIKIGRNKLPVLGETALVTISQPDNNCKGSNLTKNVSMFDEYTAI